MRILIVCQARIGSTRLPRKVMLPLAGQPLLRRFIERVTRSTLATRVVVATTQNSSDEGIVELCSQMKMDVYRGHENDLLDRHYRAAMAYGADVVVKVPSDCPLIDPAIIDTVIATYLDADGAVDFVSNLHPPSWPDGNDVEVMSMRVLERAWYAAEAPFEREHTTPWMWNANPAVRTANVLMPGGVDLSATHRWTIDYPEDYVFAKAVYDQLFPQDQNFSTEKILALLAEHPEIASVNAHLNGVSWYRHHLPELKTIDPSTVRQFDHISPLDAWQQLPSRNSHA